MMLLGYAGQYHDAETSWYYNHHRYYNPHTTTYTTQDPLGLAPAPNPTRYVTNPTQFIDPLGLALEGCLKKRIGTTVGELRKQKVRDAHHIIQDAAVRDYPGYKTNEAPGIHLLGPSNKKGTPHYYATVIQRRQGGGTYGGERQLAYDALIGSGLTERDAAAHLERCDAYFIEHLGMTHDTPLRIPGNRSKR